MSDIAMSFKAQFVPEARQVTFHTYRNGNWESQEIVHEQPLVPGKDFEIVFIVTTAGYQVRKTGTMCLCDIT